MKPLELHVAITLDANALDTLVDVLRQTFGRAAQGMTPPPVPASTDASRKRSLDFGNLLINLSEVARLLEVSQRKVWALLSSGRMPQPIRIGRCVRWRIDEIRNWEAAGCPPS
jgi:predicted DNA-binding transcriptional regulator AlpA